MASDGSSSQKSRDFSSSMNDLDRLSSKVSQDHGLSASSTHLTSTGFNQENNDVFSSSFSKRAFKPTSSFKSSFQSIGASLPTSPSPDNALSTGRRSAMGSGDLRSYVVEKELLESQLRKLQVENSSLQSENKLLKDKCNRAQSRVQNLEKQLLNEQQDTDSVTSLAAESLENKHQSEHERQNLEEKLLRTSRQLETLRAENESLERQLENSRITSDVLKKSGHTSQIVEGFREELVAIREELAKVKTLLAQSEKENQALTERHREASKQIINLTDVKNLLQQQIENSGGGSVAERQVKSLEARLRITEDRLHQERGDRAGKLSVIEEKLLSENAKLQVAEKELSRQLNREKEKHKNVDNKYKDLKEDLEQIRLTIGDKNPVLAKYPKLSPRLTNEKNLREDLAIQERKAQNLKQDLQDQTQEKESLQASFELKIKDLVETKHSSQAQIKNLEDEVTALKAENRSLLFTSGGDVKKNVTSYSSPSNPAESESLKSELFCCQNELKQAIRKCEGLQSEVDSLQAQLKAKGKALDEAVSELNTVTSSDSNDSNIQHYRDQKVEKLNAQVRSLELELGLWQEKHQAAQRDSNESENRCKLLQKQLSKVKVTEDGRVIDPTMESEKLSLEAEVKEKDEQILNLTVSYNETENELQRTKQMLVLQQQENENLSDDMEQLETDIRQKKLLLSQITCSEAEQHVTVTAMKENLNQLNEQFTQITHELKMKSTELTQEKSQNEKLVNDIHERDCTISSDVVKALQDGRLKSSLINIDPDTSFDTLVHSEMQTRLLQSEIDQSKHKVETTTEVLESLVKENSDLASLNRQLQQDIAFERAQLCQTTTDKNEAQRTICTLETENQGLVNEKARIVQDLTKQEVAVSNMIETLEEEAKKVEQGCEKKYGELDKQSKKIVIELSSVKKLLEAREREIQTLKSTIDREKQEKVTLNRKIQVMTDENSASKQDVSTLTNKLTSQMKENAINVKTTQSLASERAQLELEKNHFESNQSKDRTEIDRKNMKIQMLQKELHKAEESQKMQEIKLQETENKLSTLQALMEEGKHENVSPSNITDLDELSDKTRQLENTKRAKDDLNQQLTEEKNKVEKLKGQIETLEDENFKIKLEVNRKTAEVESLKEDAIDLKNRCDRYKNENASLQEDYESISKRLKEQEIYVNEITVSSQDKLDSLKRQCDSEKSQLVEKNDKLKKQALISKEEIQTLSTQLSEQEKVSEKNTSYDQEFQDLVNDKVGLENEVQKLKAELLEATDKLQQAKQQVIAHSDALHAARSKLEETNLRNETNQLQDQLQKIEYDKKTAELQAKYWKIDAKLQVEKENFKRLKQAFEELQKSNMDFKSENDSLSTQLETIKQDLNGRNKRLALQMRQQEENYETDKNRLIAQSQQLSVDLDESRQQLVVKNRENMSLHESVVDLESQLRESASSYKQASESLKAEREARDVAEKRNMEFELLLAKLRSKEGNEEYFEKTKAEVERMFAALHRRMQEQLDSQKGYDSDTKNRDLKRIEDLKKKIEALESSLSQEQALHIISKTQLQSLEDDNSRLRLALQSMRKRQNINTQGEKHKNRSEAINALIAKSQTQAHQMLASGNFHYETMYDPSKSLTHLPNQQYWSLTSTPRGGCSLTGTSELNRSLGTEDLSTASNLNATISAIEQS